MTKIIAQMYTNSMGFSSFVNPLLLNELILNMYSDFNEHTQLDIKNDTKKRFVCVL